MASYRVSITYDVEVEDTSALLSAGRAAWDAPPSWEMAFDEDGAVAVEPGAAAEVELTPDACIAFVLGAALRNQQYPSVPGVKFSAMSINAELASETNEGRTSNPA